MDIPLQNIVETGGFRSGAKYLEAGNDNSAKGRMGKKGGGNASHTKGMRNAKRGRRVR